MAEPTRIPERQLDLGPASYFRVVPENPPGNQVEVTPGFLYSGAFSQIDQFTGGNQTTAGFSPVLVAQQRYDLVYLDVAGVATVLAGNAVAFGSPVFDGGPGFNGGPSMPDLAVPLAYILIVETGAVVVDAADITALGGSIEVQRDLQGYRVDKGLFGSAPAGLSDIFTPLFAGETASGGSAPGVVTSPPDNYMDVLDQVQDEIKHTTGGKMFVLLTEAGGIWTGSYHYIDGAGAQQTMDPSTDTAGPAPTDLRLIGVRKIFSRNDPSRPMFDDAASRVSDQLVGTIPDGTDTGVKGKVEFAPALGTGALQAVQGNDARVGAVKGRANAGAVSTHEDTVRLIAGTGMTVAMVQAAGELQFTLSAAAGGLSNQVATINWAGTVGNVSFNPGLTTHPNLAVILNRDSGQGVHVGCCIGAGGVVAQGCVTIDGIGGTEQAAYVDGSVLAHPNSPFNAYRYTIASFTSASITMNRSGADVVTTMTGRMFVLGQ